VMSVGIMLIRVSDAAPRAWNRLPTELKLLLSTDSFRLKTFMFDSVYGHHRIRIDSVMRARSSSSISLMGAIQVPQLQLQHGYTYTISRNIQQVNRCRPSTTRYALIDGS